jgi:hypothetical protein
VDCCRPLLEKELENCREAKTVLTLGAEPFNALTPKKLGLEQNRTKEDHWLRGCPYPWGDKTIIPTLHPAFLAYSGFQLAPVFDLDLDRARRFADGKARIPEEHWNYNPTSQEVSEYVQDILAAGEFGCDIETPEKLVQEEDDLVASEPTPIDVIGLSCRRGEAIGVPPDLFDLLRPLFNGGRSGRKTIMYDFNDDFDGGHLARRYTLEGIETRDVMLQLHHLHSNLRSKNLGMAMSLYTDVPYHKNLAKSQPELYNCRDTYGALWAGQEMWERMYLMGICGPKPSNEAWQNTMGCVQPCREMRTIGARVDTDFADRHTLYFLRTLEEYEKVWDSLLPTVSWSSPKQLMALFNNLGLPPQYNTKDGKKVQTVDEDALEVYRTRHRSPVADLVVKMRQVKHAADVLQWYEKKDGRMHPRLKIHGQVGHRIQAVNPAVQTISEEMCGVCPREAVIGDSDEHWIMTADFSQIEWRCYMVQADDKPALQALEKDVYVYGQLYEEIFKEPFFLEGRPPTKYNKRPDIPPWKLLVAKSGPLGWIYGRDNFTALGISAEQSRHMSLRMDTEHPAVVRFHKKILEEVSARGYAQSVFGRIRRFPGRPKATDVFAFYGQTTAVDILCRNAILPLSRLLGDYGGRILFTVHDSVVMSYLKRSTGELSRRARTIMEQSIPQLRGYRIPVEIKVGPSWGKQELVERYLERTGAAPAIQANA